MKRYTSICDIQISIFDIMGNKKLTSKSEQNNTGVYCQTFDVSAFNNGTYFCVINFGRDTKTVKFSVLK